MSALPPDVAKLRDDLEEINKLLQDFEKTKAKKSLAEAAEKIKSGAALLKTAKAANTAPEIAAVLKKITDGFRDAIDKAKQFKAQAEVAKAEAPPQQPPAQTLAQPAPVEQKASPVPSPSHSPALPAPAVKESPPVQESPASLTPVAAQNLAQKLSPAPSGSPVPQGALSTATPGAPSQESLLREQRRKDLQQSIAADNEMKRMTDEEVRAERRKQEHKAAMASESRMVSARDDEGDADLSLPTNSQSKGTGKDIWSLVLAQRDQKKKEAISGSESAASQQTEEFTSIFVGGKAAGKSTLISGFLDKQGALEPSTALEYSFGRRAKASSMTKDVVHCWEIAGGTRLTSLLEVCLTPEHIYSSTIVLTVDLSDPGRMMEVLLTWTDAIKARCDFCLKALEKANPTKSAALEKKSKHDYSNDDVTKTKAFGIPAILVGTKYDLFQDLEAEQKKVIVKTLRFVAHTYGMALLFVIAKDEGKYMTKFRSYMNHYMFGSTLPDAMKTSPNDPVTVPRGHDNYDSIGRPGMGSGDSNYGGVSIPTISSWKEMFDRIFRPKEPEELEHLSVDDTERYKEPIVDSVVSEKEQEFSRYQRLRTEVDSTQ